MAAEERSGKKKTRSRTILWLVLVLVLASAALLLAARRVPGFGEWYAVTVYPLIVGSVGRAAGLFPVSLSELLLYGLPAVLILLAVLRKGRALLSTLVTAAAVLLFLYSANCGVNYYRVPFSEEAGLVREEAPAEELATLCEELAAALNEASPVQENGDVRTKTRAAMEKLGEAYPSLSGYYPAPKLLLVPWILSVQQVSGIYSPFFVEANVNSAMTDFYVPFTCCHELSHLRGFMREDEANFIAFLACVGSGDPALERSGLMLGFIYAGNALYRVDPERYLAIRETLPAQVLAEYAENSAFWHKYDGKVAEVQDKVNDAYLKGNGQAEGVQSYGRIVDLMLAWRRQGGRIE
ncbi:MAG: DUF3810 domain-containing protein [Eubacterium sp.]|nr:DUF3810 domain-containing protein [Eubacterium sp.]